MTQTIHARKLHGQSPIRAAALVRRRRVLFAGGAAINGALLAACVPGQAANEAGPRVAIGPAKLEVWILGDSTIDDACYRNLGSRQSAEQPQLSLEWVVGGGLAKLQTLIAAGTPPHIASAIAADLSTIGPTGLSESVSRLLKGMKDWQPDGFIPGLRAADTYKGELFAVPITTSATCVAVNQELVERAGLRMPEATWAWNTLSDYATKLTLRSGEDTTQWGYAAPDMGSFDATNDFNTILHSFGGTWLDAAGEKAAFQSPEGIAGLEWLVDLVRRRQASPMPWPDAWRVQPAAVGGARGRGFTLGATGGVAMTPFPTVAFRLLSAAVSFKWQTVLPPRQRRLASQQSVFSWLVPKGAPQREAATEFLRFASTPESLARYAVDQQRVPPHTGAATRPEWVEFAKSNPALQVHLAAAKSGVTYPSVPGWGDARAIAGTAILAAIQGNVAPKPALEDAARQADAALAKARGGAS